MRCRFSSRGDSESGFGLVSVLLFVLLISAAIAPLAVAGRVQTLATAYTHERREFEILADGLARTIYTLNEGTEPLRWQRCETARYVFYVDIQDQSGLIDLNSASPQLLQFGFRALGLDEAGAIEVASLTERYRTAGGGEAGEHGGPVVDLKHAPFEDVTELADFVDAEAISMGNVQRIFTVFNKTDTVALSHVDGSLRHLIELGRASEFLVDGVANSAVSEVTILRLRKGRQGGLMFKAMMQRTSEEGERARMLRRSVSVIEQIDASLSSESTPCGGVVGLLARSYDP